MLFPKNILAQTIIDLCYKKGLKNVVISPGSRNSPLTLGFINTAINGKIDATPIKSRDAIIKISIINKLADLYSLGVRSFIIFLNVCIKF